MLYPHGFTENLFEDLMSMDLPRFSDLDVVDKKLYGKRAGRIMNTDVKEHDDRYEVDIDLPGFKKDEISVMLHNGYLSISADKGLKEEEKDKQGKLIRQERYAGAMHRSFYVGDQLTEEDVKAKFEDGVLRLNIPKKEAKKLPEKRTIHIEG
ncbi:MAG: Hsp20/alpha crystallin family protein [Oscillospiraceae bacterium]|nr:Hsp20/alpha crystallin family protein [Oscillospiraceae bacterium]